MTAAQHGGSPSTPPHASHLVSVTHLRTGEVRAELRLLPRSSALAGSRRSRFSLTPQELHDGVRALGVLLRARLYPLMPEARSHLQPEASEGRKAAEAAEPRPCDFPLLDELDDFDPDEDLD